MKYASFGSVSSGNLSTENLLSALSSELTYQMARQSKRFPRRELRKLVNQAERLIGDDPDNIGSEVVNDLCDALEQFAPPYGYFGASEGDGADYGYWLPQFGFFGGFDGIQVADTSEVPRGYRGEVLHVNDHGNMTFYVVNSRGMFKEIWAIV